MSSNGSQLCKGRTSKEAIAGGATYVVQAALNNKRKVDDGDNSLEKKKNDNDFMVKEISPTTVGKPSQVSFYAYFFYL
ncbi:hypothetical protein M5689_019055 [Euphorbia peplus]|nr:hypothetical protein M5689_019055 [Euphorbia peplus]